MEGWDRIVDTIADHRQVEYDLLTQWVLCILVGSGFLADLIYGQVVIEGAQVTSQTVGMRLTLASLTVLTSYLSEPL